MKTRNLVIQNLNFSKLNFQECSFWFNDSLHSFLVIRDVPKKRSLEQAHNQRWETKPPVMSSYLYIINSWLNFIFSFQIGTWLAFWQITIIWGIRPIGVSYIGTNLCVGSLKNFHFQVVPWNKGLKKNKLCWLKENSNLISIQRAKCAGVENFQGDPGAKVAFLKHPVCIYLISFTF